MKETYLSRDFRETAATVLSLGCKTVIKHCRTNAKIHREKPVSKAHGILF